ncbi:Queuosine salvage protein [Meloidogyne graminicola]|uniref:Queuosine 5'-phosphate N-glycosylase/hydrolase n=1 Tax=Meloidogyne graminicola TaxID=189291 RepID=A0A8S9ZM06_9BILA|nr:Queuosine salvage protein [Meloidogyne graminicola]
MDSNINTNIFQDVLNPTESSKWIVNNTDPNLIKMNEIGVRKVAEKICNSTMSQLKELKFDECEFHPKNADRETIDWIFFIDTINYSFWTLDENSYWEITRNGTTQSGYFGLCQAVNRAIEKGIPLTSAQYMANIDEKKMEEIFKGDNGYILLPMMNERLEMIQENGKILIEKFQGSFYNCILQCSKSAIKLLELIIENFPNFRDFSEYHGRKVSFLKRAQILVADVYSCLIGKDPNADFFDINKLTMFADYRVPQALAYLGVIEYGPVIMELLKSNKLLKCNSEEEVQIRGFSIEACELIRTEINKIINSPTKNVFNPEVLKRLNKFNSIDVDIWLWLWRRKNAEEIEKKIPFHKCRSIFY